MSSIRLSPDVEEAARQLSDELGLGGMKVAVEAVFRTKWQEYRDRGPGLSQPRPANAFPTPRVLPGHEPVDAAADLDAVM